MDVLMSTLIETIIDDEIENCDFDFDEEGAAPKKSATTTTTAVPSAAEGTSSVIGGKHMVPEGVVVEELKNYDGKKDLKNNCPTEVHNLLHLKDAFDVYDKFVQTIYDDKSTRGRMLGQWKDQQFVSVMDVFRDDFANKGVRVVLCKRKSSGSGTKRWLEYIDIDRASTYVPQYDVSNISGQIINTAYTKLQFPNGVAVEELKEWKGREKLQKRIPIEVETMLTDHNLMTEYRQMVNYVVEAGVGSTAFGSWKIENLKRLMEIYRPMFAKKGIILHVCQKEELTGTHGFTEYYCWIEYVDAALQPNYQPQRSVDSKPNDCTVM